MLSRSSSGFAADSRAGVQTDCNRGVSVEPDKAGNGSGRVLLHGRHDVAVAVEREGHRRVPEALLDDLGVDARGERECRVAVPQVVQPDPGEARMLDEPVEGLGDPGGVEVTARLARPAPQLGQCA